MGHGCVSVGVRRVPWVLLGRRGHFAMVFTWVKCPRLPGAGRRAAPNARNAGISGRDRAGTRPLPDHAEEPTRNSLQRKRTHGPPMLSGRGRVTASMGHRCCGNDIHGPSLRLPVPATAATLGHGCVSVGVSSGRLLGVVRADWISGPSGLSHHPAFPAFPAFSAARRPGPGHRGHFGVRSGSQRVVGGQAGVGQFALL